VTSLVGRYVGRNRPDLAIRSAFSGLKLAWTYSFLMAALFLFIPHVLVSAFTPAHRADEFAAAGALAVSLLRLAAIYVASDGTAIVFGGALRGAGDTRWPMWVSVTLHWIMTVLCITLMEVFHAPPAAAWLLFAAMLGVLALSFFLRFRSGRWKSIDVMGEAELAPPQEPTHVEEL
jgi:MATE family multidrug resistance protein